MPLGYAQPLSSERLLHPHLRCPLSYRRKPAKQQRSALQLLGGVHLELMREKVAPDLFHVVPVVDHSVRHRKFHLHEGCRQTMMITARCNPQLPLYPLGPSRGRHRTPELARRRSPAGFLQCADRPGSSWSVRCMVCNRLAFGYPTQARNMASGSDSPARPPLRYPVPSDGLE